MVVYENRQEYQKDNSSDGPNDNSKPLGVFAIFTLAFVCLVSGHMLLKEYMPNPAIGAFGFVFIAFIMYYVLFKRKDTFGFILLIYVCSHFSYADNQGGLWNLMTFGFAPFYLLFCSAERKLYPGIVFTFLIVILVLMNLCGWVLNNPLPLVQRFLGMATFFGFVLMFLICKNVEITANRINQFLTVTLVMLTFLVIISINQRYAFLNWNTPLLGAYGAEHGAITYGTTNAKGTFRNSELFGEYAVLLFALLIPLLSSSITQKELNCKVSKILFMIFSCLFCILLTSTRSAAILAIFVIFVYWLSFLMWPMPAMDRKGRQLWFIMAGTLVIPLIGIYIGAQSLRSDFSDLAGIEFSMKDIASGKAINRGPLTEFALKRIESGNWAIGNGFSVPRGNLWAWLGKDPEGLNRRIDGYHNLYLSLPMLYGWLGASAFIFLIVFTESRLFITILANRTKENFKIIIAFGFFVFWCIFLIDQYKISILRNPNYHMIFWIWLGLSNAVVDTLKNSGDTSEICSKA